MAGKNVDFEKSLEKLEKIVERLESGDETLASTLKLYQEGIDMSENCRKILESAKQKVTVLEKKCD